MLEKLEEHIIWSGRYPTPIVPLLNQALQGQVRNTELDERGIIGSVFDHLIQALPGAPREAIARCQAPGYFDDRPARFDPAAVLAALFAGTAFAAASD